MEIIIDTNILFNDWILRSEDSRAFLDFVRRTESIIYIPRIVWEETRKNYREEIASKHSAYVKASKQFGRSLIEQPDLKRIEIDFDDEAYKYMEWLQKELRFDGLSNILPYGDFTERIANRAMAKRRPFNMQNNNEYKDTLLWETVLDVVSNQSGRGDNEVVMISNDSNAFGAGKLQQGQNSQTKNQKGEKQKGVLDIQLEEDVQYALEKGKASNFYYYESFADFLASHYTPIKGIDENSVRDYLWKEESGFSYLLLQRLNVKYEELIKAIEAANPSLAIELNADSIVIDNTTAIEDFYVYPFQKGEIVTASGVIFVYLKAQVSYSVLNRNKRLSATVCPVIEVKFNLPYIDNEPAELHFENVTVLSGLDLRVPTNYDSVTRRIDELISKMPPSPAGEGVTASILAIFNSMYEQSVYEKPQRFELWDVELDEDEMRSGKGVSKRLNYKGSNSKFIPSTGRSQPFIAFSAESKKRKAKRKK